MKTILSIVPRLPPAIDGVGDYASLLAAALAERHGVMTQFIACDPLQPVAANSDELNPSQLAQRSRESLLTILARYDRIDTLLLHYVGYGYAKRGCPQWLADAVLEWRQAKDTRRLVTMFHEVYASSNRPWNSQFWTSLIQQKIAKDLIQSSNVVLTSMRGYADLIAKLNPQHEGKIHAIPILSTIGESSSLLPLVERKPWLVTFGNTAFRKSIYTKSLAQLTNVCQQLEISEIYDIGNSSAEIARAIVPQVKVNTMGVLPAAEVSQIFRMARVGFLNYPVAYLGKSTIFAAYTSHKLLPVFDRHNVEPNQDGIELNRHYWACQNVGDAIDLVKAQSIVDRANRWYMEHNLAQTADRFADVFGQL